MDLAALRELKGMPGIRHVPYPLFPEPGGLLPFGIDDNGDGLYWLTTGEPDQWSIVVNESRAPEYEQFDMSVTEFLQEVLSRKTICEIFPSDFPLEEPDFQPS
jgi:hypothetical protein